MHIDYVFVDQTLENRIIGLKAEVLNDGEKDVRSCLYHSEHLYRRHGCHDFSLWRLNMGILQNPETKAQSQSIIEEAQDSTGNFQDWIQLKEKIKVLA